MSDGVRTGTVVSFDEARGLGVVADGQGGEWPFHCTAVPARTAAPGTAVAFGVAPGHLGRMEARQVVPLPVAARAGR